MLALDIVAWEHFIHPRLDFICLCLSQGPTENLPFQKCESFAPEISKSANLLKWSPLGAYSEAKTPTTFQTQIGCKISLLNLQILILIFEIATLDQEI